MDANDHVILENTLISSHGHFRSIKLSSSFKAIDDLRFDGMPDDYVNFSMTRMPGSRYLFDIDFYGAYWIDIDTLTANRLEIDLHNVTNCFIDGEYMLVVRYYRPMTIYRRLVDIGQIEFNIKFKVCKNGQLIRRRYEQQVGQTVYAVDDDNDLYRIEWQDIKDGHYRRSLVKSNVENFCVDGLLGLATVNVDLSLSLDGGTEVDLRQKVESQAEWTIVTCIAKCWIVSGDLDGQAIIASITNKGNIRSTLKLTLTSNGFEHREGNKYAGIFVLRRAYVRGRRGIMLAIERDGCCHLISVAYGRMSKLQSTDSIVSSVVEYGSERHVMSVTDTHTEGEFMVGGRRWTKRISLKLK